MPTWLPWLLLATALGALGAALGRLYALESGRLLRSMAGKKDGNARLEGLLARLLNLHELGVLDVGEAAKAQICQAVLDYACELVGSARGSLMLFDRDAQSLSIVASRGLPAEMLGTRLKAGEGVAGKVLESGKAIFIAEPDKDPRYVQLVPNAESREPILSLPIRIRDKTAGVLTVHRTSGTAAFTDLNVKFLTLLAAEAAKALENLELHDGIRDFYLELVGALSRAMDMKDSYTHDHGERARLKARRIAAEMGLPEEMVRYVEYAALMHDIGKIGIDDAIITKPGKLTPEEYEIMKKHPAIGHQILAPVKHLGPVSQIVLYHQEWYNGQGYPEGLKGEEIPLGSRIVAVIDAWDAMTSDRPYRKALGRDKAVSELRKGAGTQFDSKVVEVFLRLESEWSKEPNVPLPPSRVSPNPVLKPGQSTRAL
jgi:HD-GYP domain-containing protein (c-di-GMP phosphodiesterase class II)